MRLRIYQQFLRSYSNFQAMTDNLSRIADLGYNVVYINPIHLVSEYNVIRHDKLVKGSLYSIRKYDIHNMTSTFNMNLFEQVENIDTSIQGYTQRAHELNLIPIFDLVLKHIAIDYIYSEPVDSINKDWIHGQPTGAMDDVLDFKYSHQFSEKQNIEEQ